MGGGTLAQCLQVVKRQRGSGEKARKAGRGQRTEGMCKGWQARIRSPPPNDSFGFDFHAKEGSGFGPRRLPSSEHVFGGACFPRPNFPLLLPPSVRGGLLGFRWTGRRAARKWRLAGPRTADGCAVGEQGGQVSQPASQPRLCLHLGWGGAGAQEQSTSLACTRSQV